MAIAALIALAAAEKEPAASGRRPRSRLAPISGSWIIALAVILLAATGAAGQAVAQSPVVTQNPTNTIVAAGSTASFIAAASGTPAPTVQWQVSTDGGSTFGNVAGANATTLSFVTSASQNGYRYRAVFTNPSGSARTGSATLTVTSTPPAIALNPVSATVAAGSTASFSATATGVPAPAVQWQVSSDGGVTFSIIAGATSPTLSFTAAASQNGNRYRAVFTNASGSATTTSAALAVTSNAPTVVQNPTSTTVAAGSNASFSASATGAPAPTLQWQVSTDGGVTFVNIPGATVTPLNFSTSAGQNGNQYRAVFTNASGSATTTAAILTVNASAPIVMLDPSSVTVAAGSSASFSAAATGVPAPSVQWQLSTDSGATFANIAGATSASLSFATTANQTGNRYRAVFSNGSGSATTAAAVLTVTSSAPAITQSPANTTVAAGALATFSATATGAPTPSVQWQVSTDGGTSFVNIPGATAMPLKFTTTAPQNANQYRAVFTNGSGSAATMPATLTVNSAPPVITQNPTNRTVAAGSAVNYSAAATGAPAATVQWQVSTDGGASFSNISGATATSLSFTASASQDANQYRAVFTNPSGSAVTSAATLTVYAPPSVIQNPGNTTVAAGSTASFSASASGVPSPTVQWQVSTDGGATFSNIAGATMMPLTFTPSIAQNGSRYRAMFTNGSGSAFTSAAMLTVTTSGPVITLNPSNASVAAGSIASFTASATGAPAPTVQWQVSADGGATFANIAGATAMTLGFATSAAENGYRYRAVFSNGSGSATSQAATLSVSSSAPVITQSPVSTTVAAGSSASMMAAASGAPNPTVQWQISSDGGATFANLAGATTTPLTFAAAADQTGNQYRAVFTNGSGSATTTAATLTVSSSGPTIAQNPSNTTVAGGSTATFTAQASGAPSPSVQWQVSTDGGVTFANIAGATAVTLSFTASATQTTYRYRAVFSNSTGSATTNSAMLTVYAPPLVVQHPANMAGLAGSTATFSVMAGGAPAPTVQWQVSSDGGATYVDINGATSPTLTFTATANQTGNRYRAVLTNGSGSITTSAATLMVTASAPVVTQHPANASVAAGTAATFSAEATGAPAPTVQWQVSSDGGATFANIVGATMTSLTFTATPAQNASRYRAVFSNDSGSATTSVAILGVTASGPAIAQNPANAIVSPGGMASFIASATGAPAPTVQWQVSTDGGTTFANISGATANTLSFPASADQNGNRYRAVFTNALGSATTAAAVLTSSPATSMTASAGSTPQNATISTAFSNALAVTVKDAGNNPVSGVAVTFTAPVNAASGLFSNGTTTIRVATDALGIAAAAISANASPGPYTVKATAAGLTAVDFVLTNLAGKAAATTTLASSQNPTTVGQAVTFTASVRGASPTGSVTFKDGASTLGSVALQASVATFTTSSLSAGAHVITGVYSGDPGNNGSVSPALVQTVNIPQDSVKLRSLQALVAPMVAQTSGQVVSNAVESAISEGFDNGGALATPSGSGVRFNFAADRDAQSRSEAIPPDPFSNMKETTDGSSKGQPPPASSSRVGNAFGSLSESSRPPSFLGWAEVRGTTLDHWGAAGGGGTAGTSTLHGNQINLVTGLTWKLQPNFLIGVLGGYETFDYRADALQGRLKGDGWTVGSYLGWKISQNIRYDAALTYSGIGYDGSAGSAAGAFGGRRWLAASGLAGTYGISGFQIEPSARVYALWERERSYADSLGTSQPERTFSSGRASAGLKLSYPIAGLATGSVTPYIGLYGDYYFSLDTGAALTPGAIPFLVVDGWSARAIGGLSARFGAGAQAELGVERGGLGGNFAAWTYRARVSMPFQAQ